MTELQLQKMEVHWSVLMDAVFNPCSHRACGWECLIEQEAVYDHAQ